MSIEIDVHGYSVETTIKTIQKLIVQNPKCSCIEVVHGFNNGCLIKNILSNKWNIHSRRALKTLPVPFNDGRTMILLKLLNQ